MKQSRAASLAVSLALVLAGCGSAAPAAQPVSQAVSQPAAPAPLAKATLRLASYAQGYSAPYFLALDRGYFRENGIDLSIAEGKGSASTAQDVDAGHDTFGEADSGTVAALIAKGLKEKVILLVDQLSPMGTIYVAPRKLSRPQDLKGLTIGDAPSGGTHAMFPLLLKLNSLQPADVKTVAVSLEAAPAGLLSHKFDAWNTYYTTDVATVRSRGGSNVDALHWSDFGLQVPGIGVVAGNDTIQKSPALIRGFVAAIGKGFADAEKDPDAAVAAELKHFPNSPLSAPVLRDQLQLTFPLTKAPETEGHPLGWQSDKRWQLALQQLKEAGLLQSDVQPGQVFTNDFMPQG